MKGISKMLKDIERSRIEMETQKETLIRLIEKYGFIQSKIWIKGHQMREFDLFNGYLPNQIYLIKKDSFSDTFEFYGYYSPTEEGFFDILDNSYVEYHGMICSPVFIKAITR